MSLDEYPVLGNGDDALMRADLHKGGCPTLDGGGSECTCKDDGPLRRLLHSPALPFVTLMFVLAIVCIVGLAACGSSKESSYSNNDSPRRSSPQAAEKETGSNGAIVGSVQTVRLDGYTRKYVCFTYTTVDRGGLWCERVDIE